MFALRLGWGHAARSGGILVSACFPAKPGNRHTGNSAFWLQRERRIVTDLALLLAAILTPDETEDNPSSMLEVDVRQLVLRAQQGDAQAAGTLYTVFAPRVYRYVSYRTPTPTDAEDLTADVFIRMVRSLPTFQITEVPFEAWLYRIAAARVADFYRRAGRLPQIHLSEAMPSGDLIPEDEIQQRQLIDTVRQALLQLSDEHQTILILRFVERKSHEEVALILDKSMTAVKSAQHRALNHLAKLLGTDQKIRHYLRGEHG